MKKNIKGSQTAWNKFLRPAVNSLGPVIGMAVAAKTKIKQVGAVTANILKSLTGGRVLNVTDTHGNGLR